MKKIIYITSIGISVLASCMSFAGFARAERPSSDPAGTEISGTLIEDQVWTKEGSPYLMNGQVFLNGHSLTMEAGVAVQVSPNSSYGAIFIVDGSLRIQGTDASHVSVTGIEKIHITNSMAEVAYADMKTTGPGLILYWSNTKIASSSFSGSTGAGLYVANSQVEISASRIENNNIAGIAIITDRTDKAPSSVSVHTSAFVNNGQYSIKNSGRNMVSADSNWWGGPDGPGQMVGSQTSGLVAYEPWLESDPFIQMSPCCSSILFIPGLQATRLFRPEPMLGGLVSATNRLWEPNRNDDVRKLLLNSNGSSTDPTIYSEAPMDKAFGVVGIYDSFMSFLDELAHKGTIEEWKSFGYDWRMPVDKVVAGRTQRATSTESLLETVEDLAAHSKTGKVTVIAHSNGGLVAKYLVKTLAEIGKEYLIGAVISVAVPYLGTPQSLLALLHGDEQSIGHGIILKKSVAKELGTNMGSAYALLPSVEYFKHIVSPTIAFASTSEQVDTYAEQSSFVSSAANKALMKAGESIHAMLDSFIWPVSVLKWAIVGWGNLTAKTLSYGKNGYVASSTSSGDGTVITPSAGYDDGTVAAIDLKSASDDSRKNFVHSNILEVPAVQSAIGAIVGETSGPDRSAVEQKLASIPGVTLGEPDYSKEKTFLVVSTHSPVDLHVYDAAGNHTGTIAPPVDADIEEGLYTMFETNIPGSDFHVYGDDDHPETYVSLPDESGQTYSVAIRGTGVGEFTYMVERIRGEETLSSTEYVGMPATPLMTASTSVTAGINSVPPLAVDVDGNSSVDLQIQPYTTLDPVSFFDALRLAVLALKIPDRRSADLVKRIERIEERFKKNKLAQMISGLEFIQKKIGSKQLKTLQQADREAIFLQIGQFIAQYE